MPVAGQGLPCDRGPGCLGSTEHPPHCPAEEASASFLLGATRIAELCEYLAQH